MSDRENSTTGWPIQVHLAIWGVLIAAASLAGILAAWWRMLNV
jgi:hypothetical protein